MPLLLPQGSPSPLPPSCRPPRPSPGQAKGPHCRITAPGSAAVNFIPRGSVPGEAASPSTGRGKRLSVSGSFSSCGSRSHTTGGAVIVAALATAASATIMVIGVALQAPCIRSRGIALARHPCVTIVIKQQSSSRSHHRHHNIGLTSHHSEPHKVGLT